MARGRTHRAPATMEAPHYIATMTEAQWQATIVDLACTLGWLPVHFRQMVGNPSGWPDLTILRGDEVILAELKREAGVVSAKQQRWIDDLAAVGTTVHVWRPSDWPEIVALLQRDRSVG